MPGAPTSGLGRLASVYTLLVAVAVGLYFIIRSVGLGLAPPTAAPTEQAVGAAGGAHALLHVLLALVVIISLARLLGAAFRWLHQPPVIGEMVAGIILGPSLLGRIAPEASAFVLPVSVAPFLGVMSQVGVILYMFLVGLELDIGILRRRGHATVAISHASIVVPFLLGALLALYLFPRLAPGGVGFTSFSLFLGVSMSVTAFPVLARILTDRKMQRTRMGTIALTCAAVDDVTAWCLLALVVGVVKSQAESALLTTLFAGGYIGLIIFAARPLMRRLALLYGAPRR